MNIEDPTIPAVWKDASTTDRLRFKCQECNVVVFGTAADVQAGIRLYCPECGDEMEHTA